MKAAQGRTGIVIKAGEIHEFTNVGDEPLVQLDVHVSPTFIQDDL